MLFFHIGLGKVGSTTIQHNLNSNREVLASAGIQQPEDPANHGGNHLSLSQALKGDVSKEWALDEVVSMAKSNLGGKVVVSSEFVFRLPKSRIELLKKALQGTPITIMAYVRSYRAWIRSFYNQGTKKGKNSLDFDAYFNSKYDSCSAQPFLSTWAKVFGWDNLRVRHLEEVMERGGLISDFSQTIGVKMVEDVNRNQSPHWLEIEFIRLFCEYNQRASELGSGDVRQPSDLAVARLLFREALKKVDPIPDVEYLTIEQRLKMNRIYTQDIEWLDSQASVPPPPPHEHLTTIGAERTFLPTLTHAPDHLRQAFLCVCEESPSLPERPSLYRVIDSTIRSAWGMSLSKQIE